MIVYNFLFILKLFDLNFHNLLIVNKKMSAFKYTTASMLQMLDQDIRSTWEK